MKTQSSDRPVLLICDDDILVHQIFSEEFFKNFEIVHTYTISEAIRIVKTKFISVLILDIFFSGKSEGIQSISKFREIDAGISIIINSGVFDFSTVKSAFQAGADDYLPKTLDQDEIHHVITRVLEKRQLIQNRSELDHELKKITNKHPIIGHSQKTKNLIEKIERAKKSNANVLITGETGTGKEAIARNLRRIPTAGPIPPFISVDCATIQPSLAESMLFGHEKGAFTGAEKTRKGLIEEADGGILFFDEIANLHLDVQSKLLRVLQEKEVQRVGATRSIPVQFRVIAATNIALERLVLEGKFKEDLLQRLSVIPLEVPPLRERIEDIPILIEHFCQQVSLETHQTLQFEPEAKSLLMQYRWPGNIRELQNLIHYLGAMSESNSIQTTDLPSKYFLDIIPSTAKSSNSLKTEPGTTYYDQITQFEKTLIEQALQHNQWNVSKCAQSLQMDRSHLHSKIKQLGISIKKS